MKLPKSLVAAIVFAVASSSPLLLSTSASAVNTDAAQLAAVSTPLRCPTIIQDGEFTSVDNNTDSCDLSVDKQVSVNGGPFVEADTAGAAATAHVGDTITWQITVTNNSDEDLTPVGRVYVNDVLPAGVTYTGAYTATSGTYTGDDGSFFANDWNLPLQTGGEVSASTLPATLTITTTANAVGLQQNTATIVKYDTGSCDGGCTYGDADPSNDSNDAFVLVQAGPQVLGDSTTADPGSPQVLGASTLVNTGTNVIASIVAGLLIVATLVVAGSGRLFRRAKVYRLN